MKELEYGTFSYLHAGPTCGKSTLQAATWDQGWEFIDPDIILWGIIMDKKAGVELSDKPWRQSPQPPSWKAVTRAALLAANVMSTCGGVPVMTNLSTSSMPRNAVTVFREPKALAEILEDRRAAKGEAGYDTLKLANSWFHGWLKWSKEYDKAFVLQKGEYLSDLFGVSIQGNVDTEVNYKKSIESWRKRGWIDLMNIEVRP